MVVIHVNLNLKNTLEGQVGIDIGVAKVATSSVYQTELLVFPGPKKEEVRLQRVLMRKLDRQRRANNPDNFNENGTVRAGYKVWVDSKEYLKTKVQLAELKRKQAERRSILHKTTANKVVAMGSSFVVEDLSFKGMQARKKEETSVSARTGKAKSKRQYGVQITNNAPAMLIEKIRQKAELQGKTVVKANTFEVRSNQLNHITGEYKQRELSDIVSNVAGSLVHRNLYSAYLLQHTKVDGISVDETSVKSDFDRFLRNQAETVQELGINLSELVD